MLSTPPPLNEIDAPLQERDGMLEAESPSEPVAKVRVSRSLRAVLVALVTAFVCYAGWKLAKQWDPSKLEVRYVPLVLAVLPMMAAVVGQGAGWLALVERMHGARVPRLKAMCVYFDSQLARYLPGKVGLALVRMAAAPRLGLSRALVASSVLMEVGAFIVVGGVMGLSLLYLAGQESEGVVALLGKLALPLIVVGVIALGVLAFVDRSNLPRWLRPIFGPGQGPLLPGRLISTLCLVWVFWAIHGALLALAFGGEGHVTIAAAATIIAPLAGFFSLAPAGVGVREAVFSLALAPHLGAAPALGFAVASRATCLFSEFAVWLVFRVWARLASRAPRT